MSDFPDALKVWRRTRRFSQLELAAEANVSARHIAFLETGRARPSPAMIGRLGEALQIPLAARNQMLTLAGFATRYPARQWDVSEMAPIRAALEHTLEQHAPYPGIAIDRMWTVVRLNRPAQVLFGQLGMAEGSSMLDLMASDELPPLIENWPDVAHHAAQRLRTESAAQGGVAKLDRLAERLAAVPGGSGKPIGPVTPTIYRTGTMRLSLFAIIAQFGTPEDLALDDLKIELFFPADSETELALRAMSDEP
ncbi:MAG: helix-turn-helix transcriptional regulator [Hyphomonadaceae bacterium]|jgi:transcriptional regulator with XRE-family HTH domain|nr:helix-turn-helix transcriptional regulator [Hyphomonadaceae bacterium]MBP9234398.1 helix-turn-helix transcriptional regulator [Hyphomonadaceae bacterium]